MNGNRGKLRKLILTGGLGTLLCGGLFWGSGAPAECRASFLDRLFGHHTASSGPACSEGESFGEVGGTWYWLRSPDEEKRVVAGLYNRYCIRCHGVDGRGVWDIPGVPNFTNVRWQESRSDDARARIILEGRGAVMPPFRGALSLEEAWALGRYLHSFVPGSEVGRPDFGPLKQDSSGPALPAPPKGGPTPK
jgi:hypothetical protein